MKPPKPITRARLYGLSHGVTERTARKHLEMSYYSRAIPAYNRAAAVATVLRDLLPERALWVVDGHFEHRTYGIIIVVEDVDAFIETTFDDMRERLSEFNLTGVEVLSFDETERRHRFYLRDSSGIVDVDSFFYPPVLENQ